MLEDLLLELRDAPLYLPSHLLQRPDVDRHPDPLHPGEHVGERQLHLVVEPGEPHLLQLGVEARDERPHQRRPPGRLPDHRLGVPGLDVGDSPLGGQRVQVVAPKSGLDEVAGQVGVEVGAAHPDPLGVVHLQRPLREPLHEPHLVLGHRRAPPAVPGGRDGHRLQ